ncbi:MAG: hypothetical protein ABI182_04965 [Candidatus Baltobacteraceae bacterium]
MNIRRTILSLAMIGALAAPIAAVAAMVTLPAGTELNVTIDSALNTKTAQVGDTFTAHVQPPYPFDNGNLQGAVVTGEVTQVQKAGQGTKPEMQVRFDTIRLADGSSAPINGTVSASQPKKTLQNGATVAAYTIGGMLVGNAIAKTIFQSKGGGLLGAAGGFLVGYNAKSDIQFPAGSQMTVKLIDTLQVLRQASHH